MEIQKEDERRKTLDKMKRKILKKTLKMLSEFSKLKLYTSTYLLKPT